MSRRRMIEDLRALHRDTGRTVKRWNPVADLREGVAEIGAALRKWVLSTWGHGKKGG